MRNVSFYNLLIVAVIAVLAPLLVGFVPRLRVPAVVLEIVAGVVVGPSVLGWAQVDLPVQILALFGLAFLLFLAGLEIDLNRLKGRALGVATVGYLITLVLGLAAGMAFHAGGWVFFSTSGGTAGAKVVLLVAFAALVLVTGAAVSTAGRSMRLGDVLVRLQDTTAEIRVRSAVVLLIAFTAVAERFGLESILGAFLAGAVVSLVDRDSSSHPNFRVKLEAIGYGFVVPVFFVSSGIRLDLTGLIQSPSALLRVPLLLLALLVVRGVPAALELRSNGVRSTIAVALLQATSLPFLVTATQIGLVLGKITPVTGAALICAGLLSVLIFPLVALGMLGSSTAPAADHERREADQSLNADSS
jgi:Kef-type K+ transport system membrane component KefB